MKTSQKRYLITNTTRKPAPTHGPDTRSIDQKKGFTVAFQDLDGRHHMLHPDKPTAVLPEVPAGLYDMAELKHVSIEEFSSMSELMKRHTQQPKAQAAQKRPEAKAKDEANASAAAPQQPGLFAEERQTGERQAKAVKMGEDSHTQKGGTEHEGALNPDGNPNFLVKAPTGEENAPKRMRRGRAASNAAG